MAGEIEQSFVEPYADRLIRLAEKELESLPFCNNGTHSHKRIRLLCVENDVLFFFQNFSGYYSFAF